MIGSRSGIDPAALRSAARGLDFSVRPSGHYRLVRSGERRAIIELVRVEGQKEFCARVQAPLMPAHVTLFTEPGGRGIALYSSEELERLSQPAELTLPESPWRLDGDGAILGA